MANRQIKTRDFYVAKHPCGINFQVEVHHFDDHDIRFNNVDRVDEKLFLQSIQEIVRRMLGEKE